MKNSYLTFALNYFLILMLTGNTINYPSTSKSLIQRKHNKLNRLCCAQRPIHSCLQACSRLYEYFFSSKKTNTAVGLFISSFAVFGFKFTPQFYFSLVFTAFVAELSGPTFNLSQRYYSYSTSFKNTFISISVLINWFCFTVLQGSFSVIRFAILLRLKLSINALATKSSLATKVAFFFSRLLPQQITLKFKLVNRKLVKSTSQEELCLYVTTRAS